MFFGIRREAFSAVHSSAKQSWSFQISLSTPRAKKEREHHNPVPKDLQASKKTRNRETKQIHSTDDTTPGPRSARGGKAAPELREAAHVKRLRAREEHFQVRVGEGRGSERLQLSRYALRYCPLGGNREDAPITPGQNRTHGRTEQWRTRRSLLARELEHKVKKTRRCIYLRPPSPRR